MAHTMKLGHLLSDKNNQLPKDQTTKLGNNSRRNLTEMLKYFTVHTSLHGMKYMKDKRLYKVERIFWALLCITGFYFCSKVIFQLYEGFQSEHTHIHIDKINYGINQIPFPSVTFCPGTTIDWNKATQVVNNLTRAKIIKKNNTSTLLNIMKEMSKLRFSRLSELKIDVDKSTLDSLKDVNLEHVLYSAMPSCEQLFFNCSWSYDKKNCCDLFEIQKTIFGFCYSFNSLTSVNHKYKTINDLLSTNNYGIHGGLTFSVKYDNIYYPPDAEENDTALFVAYPPEMYPSKARKVRLNKKYNVNIKFICGFASSEVIDLENSNDPPCKYENHTYSYKNCLDLCEQTHICRMCDCNPSFLYARNDTYRDCTIEDLECLIKNSQNINTLLYSKNFDNEDKEESCQCIKDCKYCYYDDQVTGFDYVEKAIIIDVHYEGPTGIRYRRDLVVLDLDLLVQLGSIFGLFLGGSLITLTEFVFYCLIGSVCSIYLFFITLKNKRICKRRTEGIYSN